MRTNIVINDELIDKAMDLTGLKTKKAAVEAGLRLLIQINEQQAIRSLRGKVDWSGNLDEMRSARIQER